MSNRFSIIRITLVFILGVLSQNFLNISFDNISPQLILLTAFLYFILYPQRLYNDIFNGIIIFVFIFFIGLYFKCDDDKNYKKDTDKFLHSRTYYCISLETKELNHKYDKCIFLLKAVKNNDKWENLNDFIKVRIFFKDIDSSKIFKINSGDNFIINGNLNFIDTPKNPFEFDFKEYSKKEHIYLQDFVHKKNCNFIKNQHYNNFEKAIENLRFYFNKLLLKHITKDSDVRGVISTIILCKKDDLSKNIKDLYQKVGISHILTISGAHVAVFYYIIMLIMFFISFKKKYKFYFLKNIISVILIICYALITGCNPPILRATIVIITFIFVKNIFKKEINPIIVLLNSAFLLISLSPNIVYSTSFQFSYSCILGILLFYKHIDNLLYIVISFLYKYFDKLLHLLYIKLQYISYSCKYIIKIFTILRMKEIFILSISTYIFLLPLTIFYFNYLTFFIRSILANLLVVSIIQIIIFLGFFVIMINYIEQYFSYYYICCFTQAVSSLFSYIILLTNKGVLYVSKIPNPFKGNIAFDIADIFLYYIIIFCFYFSISYKKSKLFFIAILTIFIWIFKIFVDDLKILNQDICIEYSIKPFYAQSHIVGNKCIVYHNIPEDKKSIIEYKILPSLIHYGVKDIKYVDKKYDVNKK